MDAHDSIKISRRQIAEMLALALVYFLTAKIGQLISVPPGNVTPLWIPSGIIMAAVLIRGYWIWPGIFLGAFAGNVSAYIDFQSYQNVLSSLFSGSMNGLGDVLGTLIGAFLIRKFAHTRNPLHQSSHIVIFLLYGVLMSAAISATFGVTSLALAGFIPWSDLSPTWVIWCTGDAIGVLMFTPIIMSFYGNKRTQLKKHRNIELTAYTVALIFAVMICLEFFDLSLSDQLPLFLVMPILIWSVLRLCEQVTFISIAVVSITSVFATAIGVGPFTPDTTVNSLLDLQIFLVVMSITILMLNSVVRERQAINSQLKSTYRDLEKIVEERTQNLSDALHREKNLNSGLKEKTEQLNLTQKQLFHSQKMESLGTLAGGIAHDFNNILNIIIGNTELLYSKVNDQEPIKKNIETIYNSSNRAAELVKQILAFSRMETEDFRSIYLSKDIEDAIKMVRSTIPSNIKIEYVSHNDDLIIFGDSTQIHQIIINLCTNAYHSIHNDNGFIKIELTIAQNHPEDMPSTELGYAMITVTDNGSGIPASIIERVFDPFFTTKEIGKGTGLGLSVVHTIIESHKGLIKVTSEPGIETQFKIYFPLSDKNIQTATSTDGKTMEQPLDKKMKHKVDITCDHNIMLIDDEVEILKLYTQYLDSQGYNIISYTDPLQALNDFEEKAECIDLIITDQSMPALTGKELSKKVLDIKPTTKIILTTGYSDMVNKLKANEIGISDFLNKPVKLSELRDAIQGCLDDVR